MLAVVLVFAQDPSPEPTPPAPQDSSGAEGRSQRDQRIEVLEGQLEKAEGELRAKDIELLEMDDEEKRGRARNYRDFDENFVLRLVFMRVAGGLPSVAGNDDHYDHDYSVDAENRRKARGRVEAQRGQLQQQRDEIKHALNRERFGSLTSFMDDASIGASLGSGSNQFREMTDPEASKPQEPPRPEQPTPDPEPPPAPQSSSPQRDATTTSPALVTTAYQPDVNLVGTPGLAEIGNLSFGSGAPSSGFTIFTQQPLTTQQSVNAWLEYRRDEDHVGWSGPVNFTLRRPGQYSLLGRSGDGTAAFSGGFQVRTGNYSEEFGRGTGRVTLITKSGTNEFHGNFVWHHRPAGNAFVREPSATGASLILTKPGVGGPVLRGNEYFYFDQKGSRVGAGQGTWGFDGRDTVTFTGDPTNTFKLSVNLDFRADRATGTLQSPSGTFTFQTEELLDRTPVSWHGYYGLNRQVDPDEIAPRVAHYHGVLVDGLLTEARENLEGGGWTESRWNGFESRLGFDFDGDRDRSEGGDVNPVTGFLRGFEDLNSPTVAAIPSDPRTQYGGVRLAVNRSGAVLPKDPLLARTVLGAVSAIPMPWNVRGHATSRSTHGWKDGMLVRRRLASAQRRSGPAPAGTAARTVYFQSLGRSTGSDAIEMTYVGDAPLPSGLDNLLVLEPVSPSESKRIEKELRQAPRGKTVGMKLTMYCLNQRLLTPEVGQFMRLADAATHRKFAHVLGIWDAADRARDEGTLRPDSDAADYYHSIVQWAIWTKEQGFDERSFGDAFAQHTRKNLDAAGHKWSPEVESVVRGIVPNRWNDVQAVLKAAGM